MYKKLKKYLAVLLCFSVLLYTMHNEQQEVKAIAPVLAAGLVVGAVVLGGGIYFTHKEDLETVTKDCMDWLSSAVPDAYKDLTNLVANGGKYAVSAIAQKGILSYLKHKFGWGDASEPVRDVTIPVTDGIRTFKYFESYYVPGSTYDNTAGYYDNFIKLVGTGEYDVFFSTQYEYGKLYLFKPYAIPKGLTDVYFSGDNFKRFITFVCNGEEYTYDWMNDKIGLSMSLKTDSKGDIIRVDHIYSQDATYFGFYFEESYLNSSGLPVGTRVWETKEAYNDKLTSKLITVGQSTSSLEVPIDIGSNANLQTEDTAVSVDKVSDMTIDQFIEITKDLQQDNDAAWQDAISKITVSVDAPDIDVPDVDVPDNTSWLERIYNTVLSIPDAIGSIPAAIGEWGRSVVDNIKDLGVTIGDWGATWIDTVKDLGITIGDWFADLGITIGDYFVDLGITIGDYFVDLGITIGDWSVKIWDGLKDIPVSIGVWGKSIVDSIPDIVIPDYTKALDLIREGLASLTDIFVLDLSAVEFGPLVATLEAKFPIWGQIRSITTKLKQIEPEDEIPVIYIKTPPQFKTWIKTPEIVYVDLRPFKPFFDFCRVTLNAFIWFWVFRYIYKKFDFEITITP